MSMSSTVTANGYIKINVVTFRFITDCSNTNNVGSN